MLVLSRKKDETIHIPAANLVIKIVEVRRGTVRIGFEAPRELRIIRGEHVNEAVSEPKGKTDAVENNDPATS